MLGYLSASEVAANKVNSTTPSGNSAELPADTAAERARTDHAALWDPKDPDSIHYYVHGKDNIPFHTIILPALLIANGEGWRLPDRIISSEYLTLEGRKISTSRNYAIWLKDLLDQFDADSIRYYVLANGPEKRDADFSWNDYVLSHNSELLGAYGNFVNRTLAFVTKYYDGIVPSPLSGNNDAARDDAAHDDDTYNDDAYHDARRTIDPAILTLAKNAFASVGKQIEAGAFRDAIREVFDFVHFANKYFDAEQPWITRTADPAKCENTIFQCVQIIANLAALLAPFLPFSSEKISRWLGTDLTWEIHGVPAGYALPATEILFQRIDKKVIEEETAKLKELI